jgi:hypothetical protein
MTLSRRLKESSLRSLPPAGRLERQESPFPGQLGPHGPDLRMRHRCRGIILKSMFNLNSPISNPKWPLKLPFSLTDI